VLRTLAFLIALVLAMAPSRVLATSSWGSPGYGDPPGWCTNFSDMWVATVRTNDPLVGSNPERFTFYGFHRNPGYDDWYGFFYGDFRGRPGDASGWVKLLHEDYPDHYEWNFADSGWAVHGHVKEYVAYYNWTFGGQCGLGARDGVSPPPYMADQYGYPVVDIYVDAVAPFPPQPYVAAVTPSSVAFTWAPVGDRGDGDGQDYFISGMDHYVSWLTVAGRPGPLQLALTSGPRWMEVDGVRAGETVCAHVRAVDQVQNSTPDEVRCAGPLSPPPAPAWSPVQPQIRANPAAPGLVGLDTWFWLDPAPSVMSATELANGMRYDLSATPVEVDWSYGDGVTARLAGAAGFGLAYPRESPVAHTYEAHDRTGYRVTALVRYAVTWTATVDGRSFGPYPLDGAEVGAPALVYPVQQAQPELVST
jgi:hypothetical protein